MTWYFSREKCHVSDTNCDLQTIIWFPAFFHIHHHRLNHMNIKPLFFSMMADQMRRAVEAPSAERYSRKRKLIFSINLFFI